MSYSFQCDECENYNIMVYCNQCEQNLCLLCDLKIHNKGNRIKHWRNNWLSKNSVYWNLLNDLKSKDNNCNFYKESEWEVKYFTKFYDKNYLSIIDIIGMYYLLKKAQNGKLMIKFEKFILNLKNRLVKENFKINSQIWEKHFLKENNKFFHITKRIFGEIFDQRYISLKLKNFSLESIYWVLISIRNDLMQPNDKLVYSRIKEYFSLKINIKQWANFCNYYFMNWKSIKSYDSNFSKINLIKEDNDKNDKSLNSNNNYSYIFNIENEKFNYEDLEIIDDKNDSNWVIFSDYINDFFETKDKNSKNNLMKWFSSVENSNKKNTKNSNLSLYKLLISKNISKVIPGGKYGCALMIKSCGPDNLKNLSLGKICSLVQHSLNKQILVYFKTLLVKNNNNNDNLNIETELENDKKKKIDDLKSQIISILMENKEINLAQLPPILKKKFSTNYDIQNLGFPKLKNLLLTMDEIFLEKSKNNFYYVRLKKTKNNKNSYNKYQEINFYTLKPNVNKKYNVNNNETQYKQNNRAFSNMEDYLEKIKIIIMEIMDEHPYGINISVLQNILSNKIKSDFEPKIFKIDTFQEFLWFHLGNYIDISLKYTNKRNNFNKNPSYIVFLKNLNLNKNSNTNNSCLLNNSNTLLSDIKNINMNDSENLEIKKNEKKNISSDISLINFNNLLQKDNSFNNDKYKYPHINIYSNNNNVDKDNSIFTYNSDLKNKNLKDYENNSSFNLNNIYFNNSIQSINKELNKKKLRNKDSNIDSTQSKDNTILVENKIEEINDIKIEYNISEDEKLDDEPISIKFTEKLIDD